MYAKFVHAQPEMPLVGGAFGGSRKVDRVGFDRNRAAGAREVGCRDRDRPFEIVIGPELREHLAGRGHAHAWRSVEIAKWRLAFEREAHTTGRAHGSDDRSFARPTPAAAGHRIEFLLVPPLRESVHHAIRGLEVELADTDKSPTRVAASATGGDRPPAVAGAGKASRDVDESQEVAGRDGQLTAIEDRAVECQLEIGRRITRLAEVMAAHNHMERRRTAPHP